MNKAADIKKNLEEYPQYQETLFTRGYLVTNRTFDNLNEYPFYNNWGKGKCGKFKDGKDVNVYYHKKQDHYTYEEDGITASMIGHAYNPFDMKYKEVEILKDCIQEYKKNEKAYFEKISELTGIHIIIINDNGKLIVLQDCAGIRSCYYGMVKDDICITSHPQLIGDIYDIDMDNNAKKLMRKWFYPLGGGYLPGDLSPYKDLKRLGPNTLIRYSNKFDMERFYPTKPHPELSNDKYEKTLNRIAELMNKNIELCTKKWNTPAISITGGMDSKTTLSCANGLYDKYKSFTFYSKPQELEDSKVAELICDKIGIKHKIYPIPSENEEVEDYEILKQIIYHNSSYIDQPKENEVRKYIFLNKLKEFDVELKSWVSEIGRAMQGRKLGLDLPKTLTPRHFTIFNTRYFATPKLLRYSDTQYKDYLKRIALDKPLYNYLHGDSFQWEFRDGSWASNATTTQDIFSHTVTMPMNNRKLIDMFLWFPYEYRKQDKVHKGVIKASNEEIAKLDVGVKNKSSRTKRLFIEKTYYYYRTLFYKNNN